MKRREFITLLGGAAAAWPLAARAQQADRKRRIGILMTIAANDPEAQARIVVFAQALQALGWTDGRNARIDVRWSTTRSDTLKYAAELAALSSDVILAEGTEAVGPLQAATRTIPIVFVLVPDPVGQGFVDSLARPGANVTGFTLYEFGMAGKWLQLLKEIAPHVTRAAVIRDSTTTGGVGQFAAIQSMAPSLGVEAVAVNVRDPGENPKLLSDLAHARPAGYRQSLSDTLFQLRSYPRPSEPFALALGPRQASTDPFLNHGPLELGKHAHHLKHRLSSRRRRVEALLMQEQVDTEGMQLGQKADKVLQAAAQPID